MMPIRKNSNEYFLAKSKAINVLFFSKYNNGMYEKGVITEEYWRETSSLYKDDRCYVLKDCSGSYHRWSI